MKKQKNIEIINSFSIILTFICFVVFLLQKLLDLPTFILVTSNFKTAPWTIITYIFLHASIPHLLYNIFALSLFGIILESIIGRKKFLLIFFFSGIFSGVASLFFYKAVLGASGAIFGILGCLAILRPKMKVFLFGVPMPMLFALFFWGLGDLLGFFVSSNVANASHLAGLIFGIVVGIKLKKDFGKPFFKKKAEIEINDEELEEWEKRYMG